ncbi:MAG TPA: transglutaminase-like cysteine peptidase [Methylophilus sp.]
MISHLWRMIFLIMLPALGFSVIHAANFNVSKLSTLAKTRYGEHALQMVIELNQLVQANSSASEQEKLQVINHFFNSKLTFAEDVDIWKQSDYWATPLESIGLQAADCEDFSIAKYVFLKVLNIPNEKLRLTYVRAQLPEGVQAHMVLSYYATPSAEPLILDNLTPEILPASNRHDLSPIFSFNDQGIWVGNSAKPKAISQSHLSKWRDVLARVRADGIE